MGMAQFRCAPGRPLAGPWPIQAFRAGLKRLPLAIMSGGSFYPTGNPSNRYHHMTKAENELGVQFG